MILQWILKNCLYYLQNISYLIFKKIISPEIYFLQSDDFIFIG